MSKHQAMTTYLSSHVSEIAGEALKFNFSTNESGSIAFLTQYSDKEIKKYKSGSKKQYGFAILITKPYSKEDDNLNLLAMEMAQAFQDWIDAQDKIKNYPVFTGCDVLKIESLQDMPNLSGVDETETLAQYMLQCRVTYYESK